MTEVAVKRTSAVEERRIPETVHWIDVLSRATVYVRLISSREDRRTGGSARLAFHMRTISEIRQQVCRVVPAWDLA